MFYFTNTFAEAWINSHHKSYSQKLSRAFFLSYSSKNQSMVNPTIVKKNRNTNLPTTAIIKIYSNVNLPIRAIVKFKQQCNLPIRAMVKYKQQRNLTYHSHSKVKLPCKIIRAMVKLNSNVNLSEPG